MERAAPSDSNPRPPAKPPFPVVQPPSELWQNISDLTLMRDAPWRARMLSVRYSGGKSFRDRFPNEFDRILDGITNGVPVDYVGDRTVDRFGPNLPISFEDRPKVTKVIEDDVRDGKKAGPFARKPFPIMCISPIGCVPKKNSEKVRVIHHLSFPHGGDSVNASIVEEPLYLPTFGHAARVVALFGRGALLIKLDVSAAYKQVPVRKEDWPLLGFLWESSYYHERVLPFGLRSSCRLWDLYAAALHYFLYHHLNTKCRREVIHYVDDFLFIVEPGKMEEAQRMLAGAIALCAELGLPLAAEKTEGPVTCLTFLGIELDTIKLEARLPEQRLSELRRLMVEWGQRSLASIRDLQSIAGLLNFAAQVIRPGRFWLSSFYKQIALLLRTKVQPTLPCKIPRAVSADVSHWKTLLHEWNGVSVLYDASWLLSDRIELFTDACEDGYGGVFGNEWFAGRWSPAVWGEALHDLSKRSMPFLELYALVSAAVLWGEKWKAKKITFRCDCMPVVQAIGRGSSRSRGMNHLLRILCRDACINGYDFRAEHIAGADNVAADALSRWGDCQEFRAVCPNSSELPLPCPAISLPLPRADPVDPPVRSADRAEPPSQMA
jgi:hypothetical protein